MPAFFKTNGQCPPAALTGADRVPISGFVHRGHHVKPLAPLSWRGAGAVERGGLEKRFCPSRLLITGTVSSAARLISAALCTRFVLAYPAL
jgi:hypothetical protein